jgi:hypothetical protein
MKRVQVRPGKVVAIPAALAEKMVAVRDGEAFTREQLLESARDEPRGVAVYAGPLKSKSKIKRR